MKIKSVIFDLDGTLLNTLEDLTDSVNHVLTLHGMPERSIAEVRRFVGNGIPKLIERAVAPGTSAEETAICIAEMLEYYSGHCNIKTAPYPGINALLQKLQDNGIRTAVVTNKAQGAADALCTEKFGGRLSLVVGAREGLQFKPAPDGVFAAMREIGAEEADTVFVGDSDVDMQTAIHARLAAVGVLWGFRDREELEKFNPEWIVDTVAELETVLLS